MAKQESKQGGFTLPPDTPSPGYVKKRPKVVKKPKPVKKPAKP